MQNKKIWKINKLYNCILLLFILANFTHNTALSSQYDQTNKIQFCPALDLLVPSRFDIIAKYIYAKHNDMSINSTWATDLYYAHLRVWNNFYEAYPLKTSSNDYVTAFNSILKTCKKEGFVFPAIEVDPKKVPLDGSHRIAASLLYHHDVPYSYRPNPSTICASASFFKQAYFGTLEEKYLDAMALEYVALKKNTYVALIFPVAQEKEAEIKTIMGKYAQIVYDKTVVLHSNGPLNLIKHIYKGEAWLGSHNNNFAGVQFAAHERFPLGNGTVRVYLLESDSFENIKACKEEIRALFGLSNKAIHTTDTHEQTLLLAQTVFNKNSLSFFNNRNTKSYEHFEKFFSTYKQWLEKHAINPETVCIDSSAVLAAYGLRDCNDLDFIAHRFNATIPLAPNIDNHSVHAHYYDLPLDEIIFNPTYHFYWEGLKFTSLDIVKQMKEKRAEGKDIHDIQLINQLQGQ